MNAAQAARADHAGSVAPADPLAGAAGIPVHIAPDHPVFAGHFPGAPLVPGALLLSMVMEAVLADAALASQVGTAPRIASAKFTSPARPGDAITLHLSVTPRGLKFELRCGDRLTATGQFETAEAATPAAPSPPGGLA